MRWFILLNFMALFVLPDAFASRVPEIEKFYSDQVSEILSRRFPDKPFTVFVTVDTGRQQFDRKAMSQRNTDKSGYKLPYTEWEAEEIDLWERTDLPLGTLIAQLQSVKIDVKVDSTLSEAEVEDLKQAIAKQLRLDDRADSVMISRMEWTEQERRQELYTEAVKWGGVLTLLFVLAFMLARLSVRHLVKGLSKPIQEIGLSTKKFADEALNLASDLSLGAGQGAREVGELGQGDDDNLLGSSILEVRKNALELLERNRDLFQNPDAHLLEFLEKRGSEDPKVMGSILAELNESELLEIFRYGKGEWWFVALSNPGVLNAKSLKVLNEVDRLRMRRHFAEATDTFKESDAETKALLVLSRLPESKLSELCQGMSPDSIFPVLIHLPKRLSLATAKAAFPGHWARFLEYDENTSKFDPSVLKELAQKSLREVPLRNVEEIRNFFNELDTATYLDSAPPEDERDFYKVLPESSKIRKFRFPFFKIIEGEKDVLKTLGPVLNVPEWAQVLYECDERDRDKILTVLPERLSYQIRQVLKALAPEQVDHMLVARARRSLIRFYLEQQHTQVHLESTPSGELQGEVEQKDQENAA